jgi:Zn-dependent protease with chaperone function
VISLSALGDSHSPLTPNLAQIDRGKEKTYFWILVAISTLIWLFAILSIVGIFYIGLFVLYFLFLHGLFVGNIMGNSVLVGTEQFPDIYERYITTANNMGFVSPPKLYILQSGGLLNAFATRFLGSDFIVIYSDVLEMAYEQGEEAVDFILGHELAHHHCKHTGFWSQVYILPGKLIPFLGTAYSRSCEYTCDHYGTVLTPEGLKPGILALACGKKLHRRVNLEAYIRQIEANSGFWVFLSEKLSTHPNLPKRIRKLQHYLSFETPIDKPIV